MPVLVDVGDRVNVSLSEAGQQVGTVRFIGETYFKVN